MSMTNNRVLGDLSYVIDAVHRVARSPQSPEWWAEIRKNITVKYLNGISFKETYAGDPTMNLTDQETRILSALSDGLTIKETAEFMGLTENTVKTHLNRLYKKMNANNGTHAVARALRTGVIQ